jgi:intracellular septation protein A
MWAIYWRYLLAVISVFLITVLIEQQIEFLSLFSNENYQPTAFWMLAVFLSLFLSAFTSKGIIYLFFGERLKGGPAFWRRMHHSFIGLFLTLAFIALLASFAFTAEYWAYYKLFFQPTLLVFWPLFAGGYMQYMLKNDS